MKRYKSGREDNKHRGPIQKDHMVIRKMNLNKIQMENILEKIKGGKYNRKNK